MPRPGVLPSILGLSNRGSYGSKPGWWADTPTPGSQAMEAMCPRAEGSSQQAEAAGGAVPGTDGQGVQQTEQGGAASP